MKTAYLLAFLPIVSFGQNLKPDETAIVEFDVMPKQSTYIGKTKVAFKPQSGNDFSYRSVLEGGLNTRVYTIVENFEQSDIYFTYHYTAVTKIPQETTSKTETRTKKDGSTYNVTTYTTTQTNHLVAEVGFYTPDGTRIKLERREQDQKYEGTGNSKSDAVNAMATNRQNNESRSINDMFKSEYSVIQAEYLIANEKLMPFTFFIKSRKENYSDMNRVHELMAVWFKAKVYNADDAGFVEAMQIIDQVLQEHDPYSKKARIDNEVASVCHYYIAYAYFVRKMYKEAYDTIMKSEELDKRIHFSQERLKDMMNLMKDRKMFA